jgi:hypothetical protein
MLDEAASESEEEGLGGTPPHPLGSLVGRSATKNALLLCHQKSPAPPPPWEGFKGQREEARSRMASTSFTAVALNKCFHQPRPPAAYGGANTCLVCCVPVRTPAFRCALCTCCPFHRAYATSGPGRVPTVCTAFGSTLCGRPDSCCGGSWGVRGPRGEAARLL